MLEEAIGQLAIQENGIYLDCTFGRGGHSQAILNKLSSGGRLIAFDKDNEAVNSIQALKLKSDNRFVLQQQSFSNLLSVIENLNFVGKVDGILMDLGVSSPQLDNPERGFSFLYDGALDMRMNNQNGLSAAEWIAKVDEKTLVEVLFKYGEENFAKRIAKAIIQQRIIAPFSTTKQLAKTIEEAIPFKEKHKHPATRSFQAIRIAVNNELNEITTALNNMIPALNKGGRLVVISFHSLEDRLVKQFIRYQEKPEQYAIKKLPLLETQLPKGTLKSIGKAIKPSVFEVNQNPRARSAIMRVAERV